MPADDRFREILKGQGVAPQPSADQIEEARAALHNAYRSERQSARQPWWRPAVGWAAAALTAIVAAVLILPGSTPSVDANLAEIARVARTLTVDELPAGSYVYVHWETTELIGAQLGENDAEFFYLFVEEFDSWVQGDSEERVITVGRPTFFDAAVEAAYYAGGYDAVDAVGKTRIERFGDIQNRQDIERWADDVDTLQDQIAEDLAGTDDAGLEESVRIFLFVAELLDPTLNAAPSQRAALLEILGSLDVGTAAVGGGLLRVTLEADRPGSGLVRHQLDIDSEGFLRASTITLLRPEPGFPIPINTPLSDVIWHRPVVVDGVGTFPAS